MAIASSTLFICDKGSIPANGKFTEDIGHKRAERAVFVFIGVFSHP